MIRGKKKEVVVVTGSSGLIGTAVIKRLAQDYQMVGLDNVGFPYPPREAECVSFDITSDESMARSFDRIRYAYGNRIVSVIHLAAYYSFSTQSSPLYETITVQGTKRLLRFLRDFEVEQFIFSSSMLVYKPSSPGIDINEDWPLEPQWDYPKSKVATEEIIKDYRGDIPAVMLRVAGVYNEEGHSIPIANQIQRVYERQITARLYPGDTSHGSTFVHLDDVVSAIVKALEKRKKLPAELTLNIGGDDILSYREMQEIISYEIFGKKMPIVEIPKLVAKAGAKAQNLIGNSFIKPWMVDLAGDHYQLNSEKAKEWLDWQPEHTLRNTLPLMIANLKKDPEAFYALNKLE